MRQGTRSLVRLNTVLRVTRDDAGFLNISFKPHAKTERHEQLNPAHPRQPSLSALINSGCYGKVPWPEWLTNHRRLFLTVLEARVLRLG